ncbi:MAG: T9SS type A sorting domain-containing protein [bacterium]
MRILNNVNEDTLLIPITLIVDSAALVGTGKITPQNWGILELYPQPFNDQFRVLFALPQETSGTLELYDLNGRLVNRIWEGKNLQPVSLSVDMHNLPSGIYLLTLSTSMKVWKQKIVSLK